MTIEEKLYELFKKGELVHVSLAASGKEFRAIAAFASQLGGYATGVDADPVKALMGALCAPIKTVKRSSANPMEQEERGPVHEDTKEESVAVDRKPAKPARLNSYM